MTEMTKYAPGQFSWVDLMARDAAAAKRFYGPLFGWEWIDNPTGEEGSGIYTNYTLREKQVAGMGEMSAEMKQSGMPPVWSSYVTVEDADATAARVTELGGSVMMPVMQVLTVGRMAIFADPQGAAFSVWQPQDHIGAELVNEPGCFCWNELATTDVEGARRFYGDLFGWTFDASGEGDGLYVEIKQGDRGNGGIRPLGDSMAGVPPHWGVYFAVEDCEKSVEQIRTLGGQVIVPPTSIEPGTFSVCSDDAGAMFIVIALTVAD